MTLDEAYQILGVSANASESERHAAFHTKQERFQTKLKAAPTAGLKSKYEAALQQLEAAIELVEISADPELQSMTADVPQADEPNEAPPKKTEVSKTKPSLIRKVMLCLLLLAVSSALCAGWWFKIEVPRREAAQQRLTLEVKTHMQALAAAVKELRGHEESVISDHHELQMELKYVEDSGNWHGINSEYQSLRFSQKDAYLKWLREQDYAEQIEQSMFRIQEAMDTGAIKAGAQRAQERVASLKPIFKEVERMYQATYDDALIEWMLQLEARQDWAVMRLQYDEPDLIARVKAKWREDLSYLDEHPAQADALERLDAFALLVGRSDVDYQRWLKKVLPSVRIESSPAGATVLDANGRPLGQTPLTVERVRLGNLRYTLSSSGYENAVLELQASLNTTLPTQHVALVREIPKPKFGEPWSLAFDSEEGMELLYVRPGEFMMGSMDADPDGALSEAILWLGLSDEIDAEDAKAIEARNAGEKGREADEIQHQVTLPDGYWLGQHEVTQGQWAAIMSTDLDAQYSMSHTSGEAKQGKGNRHPMYYVSWEEAMEFCRRLTERERAAGRLADDWEYTLPTEAQWEYACRAGTTTAFAFGEELDPSLANCAGNFPIDSRTNELYRHAHYNRETLPVGSHQANEWGFYDMHGNLREWCRDWYGEYPESPVTAPKGPETGTKRSCRGGSLFSLPAQCRSAYRGARDPLKQYDDVGFRVALSVIKE